MNTNPIDPNVDAKRLNQLGRQHDRGFGMPYSVKASVKGHTLLAAAGSAKVALAKAIEWHIAKQMKDVTISDGSKNYSIAEFAEVMAHSEIVVTWQDSGPSMPNG